MKQYITDAFTDKIFSGNPAAVCICGSFPSEELMMKIAEENNLSETAFVSDDMEIRWFTPGGEIDLCGHATLAAAYIMSRFYGCGGEMVFRSRFSGDLKAFCHNGFVSMDFPARPPVPVNDEDVKDRISCAFGCPVSELYKARDYMAVTDNWETVRNAKPDISLLGSIPSGNCGGFILTAEGGGCDFVSRFFCPALNVPEDPVTGSSHCTLIPFWSARLGKRSMTARQLSSRGGMLYLEDNGERVRISGCAAVFSIGEIMI
ncbi:MAG: PhzF family phenazine biosynthesis protein [Ruminococcus sp.]|nr:PhzF family phenazine biosynthesis protein [Ruminococcus sp.]